MRLAPRGSFVDLVFRLVMFHQSLDGVSEWPPVYSLNQQERALYCDKKFFRLMKVLMIADSESYQFLGSEEQMLKFRMEFEANNERMVQNFE